MIKLENDFISICFSEKIGNIQSIFDKSKKIEFIKDTKGDPFRIETKSGFECKFETFSYTSDNTLLGKRGYILEWTIGLGVRMIGKIQVSDKDNEIFFYSEVLNDSDESIPSVEYPIICNIGNISDDGNKDYLAHNFASGFLIHNPLKNFENKDDGLRYMLYPDGFSGSTMQFFTYYAENTGGLYFAAYDGRSYTKWLNFFKGDNNLLEASFIHGYEDFGPQKGIKITYPVVIKTLIEGSWYEAADIYKKWAVKQKWCEKGELSTRNSSDKCKWLLEEIGMSTFGIDSAYDRTLWIKLYHELIKTPIFHILGPDWARKEVLYYSHVFGIRDDGKLLGGFDDFFPARFNKNNIDTINELGDKFAPFEFDYLFDVDGSDGEIGKPCLQVSPLSKAFPYWGVFTLLCPFTEYMRNLHIERDRFLEKNYNVDGIYYDVSGSNIFKACIDPDHGHKIGAGRDITTAFKNNYIDTKNAMISEAGKYIPMGTEVINELYIDVLDFYQTRAGGQPGAPMEGLPIRHLLISGEASLIPLFTYVYHEYGPVRLDGWGKLVEEIGDLFYSTAAKVYLWGGLYELNYEFSPMEAVDGVENLREEHYYNAYDYRGYPVSIKRANYLSKFALLRTGVANKYLAYGKMMKPLRFVNSTVSVDWFLYNTDVSYPEYHGKGEISVDAIVHSAWSYRKDSLGFFFANITDNTITVKTQIDMRKYSLHGSEMKIRVYENGNMGESSPIKIDEVRELNVTVPAKDVIFIEIL